MVNQAKSKGDELTNPSSAADKIVEEEALPAAKTADAVEQATQPEQPALLADILKAAAGRSGGLVGVAVDEFLGGKGELLEVVRSSLTGRKTAAKKKIAAFLEEKFKLPDEVALILAALLIKVAPAVGSLVEEAAGEKQKPPRKKPSGKKKAARTPGKATGKAAAKKKAASGKKTNRKAGAKKTKKSSAKAKKPAAKPKKKAA